jgi:hypothetical protein
VYTFLGGGGVCIYEKTESRITKERRGMHTEFGGKTRRKKATRKT